MDILSICPLKWASTLFSLSFSFEIDFSCMCAHMYYRRDMYLYTDERDVECVKSFNMYGEVYFLFIMEKNVSFKTLCMCKMTWTAEIFSRYSQLTVCEQGWTYFNIVPKHLCLLFPNTWHGWNKHICFKSISQQNKLLEWK